VEANSTGGQGSRRTVAPSDDDDDDDDDDDYCLCQFLYLLITTLHTDSHFPLSLSYLSIYKNIYSQLLVLISFVKFITC
jgi:hypothetical protein